MSHTTPKKTIITSAVIVLLLTFLLRWTPEPVHAQSSLGLTAIPPRLEDIVLKPGQTVTRQIKVRNESNTEKLISTVIRDFIVDNDSGIPKPLPENTDPSQNRWAASSWISVSPTSDRLKPGETKSLTVTIIAPENALPGGHYAMILHTPSNNATLNQTGSMITTYVGTLVYITVPGNVKEDAQITQFDVPKFQEYGPIDIKTTIQNLSDIHITPSGLISITNLLGMKTADLQLDSTNIFPGTSRSYDNVLNRKWLFGRYKAQFIASYGTTGQALLATAFFWVIPWRLLLTVGAVIIILALLFVITRHPKKTTPLAPSETTPELETLKKKYKDK